MTRTPGRRWTRVVPMWVGIALIASLVGAFVLHGGAVAFISDYCMYAAPFCFGLFAARRPSVPAAG